MTRAANKILAGAREALAVARRDPETISKIRVTPSCGCVFCDMNLEPVKLRRRWVHHIPKRGRLIPCDARNLKPRSAA